MSGRDAARRGRWLGAAAVVLATLALGGCTAGGESTPGPSVPVGNRPGVNGTPLPAGPTAPVPAPGGSGVTVTVTPPSPVAPVQETIGKPATVSPDVSLVISNVAAITATAQGPGEVSGPAVAVTIDVDNATAAPLDLSLVQVNLTDAKGLPGSGMTAAPAAWFSGSLAAGEKATGVYVFAVPVDSRDPVEVEVSANPTLPTVVFSGPVA